MIAQADRATMTGVLKKANDICGHPEQLTPCW